ncbi:MAG: hypothetical protein HYX41_05245 [Bdellovibrio sp.]|nr:hypothetical protein [Bdellovibrio sp.]
MEEANTEVKVVKPQKPTKNVSLRVRKETRRKIIAELARINRKALGRPLYIDDFLAFAISLISPEHIEKLQESSLSNADRLERDYRAYITQIGPISKDEYLGKRLNGEIGSQKDSGPQGTSNNFSTN